MNKTKRFLLVSASIAVILLLLSNWVAPVQAEIENTQKRKSHYLAL
jgi:hypothetical protein